MLAGLALIVDIFAVEMPIVTDFFAREGKPTSYAVLSGVIASLCLLGAEYIAFTLFCMMNTLNSDPFVERNVLACGAWGLLRW